ncbi:tetratricopeptide repeat-containing sulfotransferase family protein [Novosphingobium nitrogenifigens]|nr:tetratricopeptide repeat-containing sulfotransferase family protein [Novosphingobium nitrogenifigens]
MTDPVARAAAALATDPRSAAQAARVLVQRQPGDPRPRLILASALRRLGQVPEALPLLIDLARAFPRAARTRYELGLCLDAVGQRGEGLNQLEQAVAFEPGLVDAWQALADMAFADGDEPRLMRAQAALARLAAGNPQVGKAAELVVLGRHAEAEPILRQYLQGSPRDAEAARLLAACYVVQRAFDHAETLLCHALAIDPGFVRARFDLAHALFARQQAEPALAELAPLLAADPANPAYRNLKAGCLALIGDDAGAAAIHGALASEFPHNARIAINHGHALRTTGARDQAIAEYRRALGLHPGAGEAWWGLANLKVGALTQEDEAQMRASLATRLGDEDRLHIEYALGRRAEDAGDIGNAFAHYQAGATLARRRQNGAVPDYGAELDRTRDVFTPAFLGERADWGDPDPAPIFVLGLPRSGSTLVEQILASHGDVEGTMELPFVPALAGQVEKAGGLAALDRVSRDEVARWGAEYLERTRVHRRLGRPRFIDKMPNNFRHIGLIRLALPNARIIDVRRNPMASCFSCFKQLFAEGQEFSYDLNDLAAYYRHYLATIRHFHEVAPGAVHTLIYEDLVEDTEGQVRGLLDYLDLPFDPATLRFFENDRAVRTVSSEQVRQPIYRSGLDHWRAFEAHLAPLAQGLGDALESWRG